jgi:biopolymer transport protein ExbD
MNIRSRNKVDATFNMSSMTDIVFLLLIFFIVLSTFVSIHGLDIDLPKTKSAQNPIKSNIIVEITKDYTYAINGKTVGLPSIISELKTKAAGEESPSLILVADGAIKWESGMEIIAEAKSLGYTKIVVRTEPKK